MGRRKVSAKFEYSIVERDETAVDNYHGTKVSGSRSKHLRCISISSYYTS
jgi:hypothetical protein